jgi:serine O-acetyltransferase
MQTIRQSIGYDLYRYRGKADWKAFIKLFFSNPGFKYSSVMRAASRLRTKGPLFFPLHAVFRFWLKRLEYKFGISIPYNTAIGPGLYIGHFGGIVVNPKSVIGANCNLNHGVTIGETFGGKHPGVPSIGSSVYIGPNAVIIGGIRIGNNVAIGASSVVNHSFDDYSVIAGNPARVISDKGSSDYIINTVTVPD